MTEDAAGRCAFAVSRQCRQCDRRRLDGRHDQIYRRSQDRRRSTAERFRRDGARGGVRGAVGILESAGSPARAIGRHLRGVLVCRALDHAAGRATGRHHGDAGRKARTTSRCPAPSAATSSATWRVRCWCSATRRSRRIGWKRRPPISRRRPRPSASATRRRGPPRRRRCKHVVDALGEGLEQLAKGALTYRINDGVRRRVQEGAETTSTRRSRSCRRPSARS